MGHEDNEQELREGWEEWEGGEGVGVNVGARRGGGKGETRWREEDQTRWRTEEPVMLWNIPADVPVSQS